MLGSGGGEGGDFKTYKIDARFFLHVIQVEIFFFPSKGKYFFWLESLGISFCY